MTIFFSNLLYRGIPVHSEEWVFGSYIEHWADTGPDDVKGRKYFIAPNELNALMQTGEDTWVHKVIEIQRDTLGVCSGLGDFDGNDIYSGDILERVLTADDANGEPERFIVLYLDDVFVAEGSTVLLDKDFEQCRIIGNTFEKREIALEISAIINAKKKIDDTDGNDAGDAPAD